MAAYSSTNGVTTITATSIDGNHVDVLCVHDEEARRRVRQSVPPCTARIFKLKDVFGAADGANVSVVISRYNRGYAYSETARLTETVEELRATFAEAGQLSYFPKARPTFGGVWRSWGQQMKQAIGYDA